VVLDSDGERISETFCFVLGGFVEMVGNGARV